MSPCAPGAMSPFKDPLPLILRSSFVFPTDVRQVVLGAASQPLEDSWSPEEGGRWQLFCTQKLPTSSLWAAGPLSRACFLLCGPLATKAVWALEQPKGFQDNWFSQPLPSACNTLLSLPPNSHRAQWTGRFLKEVLPDYLPPRAQAPVIPTLPFSFMALAVRWVF